MTKYDLQQPSADAEETIRALQAELAETNRGLIALTWELEQRVDERTAQLRAAHDELQRTNAELMQLTLDLEDRVAQRTESEERFRNLAETASDAIISADASGKIIYFNPAAERIFSYSSMEIIGQPLTLLMPERFHQPHRQGFERFLRTREARVIGKTVELAGRRKNGSEFPIELSLSTWKTREGSFFTALLTDITERKQTEEALVRAKEEAERANRFKDQFLSTMSHELRTPMNAVLGFSELLTDERYGALNERQKRYINHIRTGGQHLLKLINDILDLSKIEAGRLELTVENVKVETAVAEVLDVIRPLAERKSQTLLHRVEEDTAVQADTTRFKQILMNLLGNAIKFTPEGGRIELSARRVDGQVRTDIRDSGPGIPLEEQKRIFEAFHRLQQSGQAPEGTGLGLAITKRLIELQGGQLGLESEVGKGSCFWFSLPGAVSPRKKLAGPEGRAVAERAEQQIVIIEDDRATAQLILAHLTGAGYGAELCLEPHRALQMVTDLQPQAVTLDLLMKPVNGWEILLELKNDLRTKHIPVVVVTVVDQPGMGITLGADEFLVKPVEKEALLRAVQRCLETRGGAPRARPILVVEDDTATREIIAELLTTQGYRVTTAADGAQARDQLDGALPALVILDLMLPKVSGFELLAEWRSNPRTADLPVFVLTSKDLSREEEKYLRAHAESLLRKNQSWQEDLLKQLSRVMPQTHRV